jgi:hypothetical protein
MAEKPKSDRVISWTKEELEEKRKKLRDHHASVQARAKQGSGDQKITAAKGTRAWFAAWPAPPTTTP